MGTCPRVGPDGWLPRRAPLPSLSQVALKLSKHCKEWAPQLVTGLLLGLDIGSTLEVTHCFPMPVSPWAGTSWPTPLLPDASAGSRPPAWPRLLPAGVIPCGSTRPLPSVPFSRVECCRAGKWTTMTRTEASAAAAAAVADGGTLYQLEMMKCLRDVNVDNNIVGWYARAAPTSFLLAEAPQQRVGTSARGSCCRAGAPDCTFMAGGQRGAALGR